MQTISHRSKGFAPETRETRETADTLLFMHEDFEVL
jgi:phosphoserine aminotransferase